MHRSKEKIPYELKNAREWDPSRRAAGNPSSDESSDNECDDDEWGEDNHSTSTDQAEHDTVAKIDTANLAKAASLTTLRDRTNELHDDDDGFQVVQSRSKKQIPRQSLQAVVGLQTLPLRPAQRSPALSSQLSSCLPQHSTTRRRFPRRGPPNKHRAIFTFKNDNAAKAAFRKRLPSTGQFILHKDAHEIEPDQKRMYDIFEEMGVRFNSFIRPPQKMHDRELLIWGNARQVSQTTSAIKEWLKRSEEVPVLKSRGKEAFSKEMSIITNQYKNELKRIERDAAVKRFQQVPDPDQDFGFTGTYLWPMDEVNPHDIFGLSIEAFDSVRFQNKCHITFDDRQEVFKIFSDKISAIEDTIACIEGALKGFVAQNSRRVVEYAIELPSISSMRRDVKLIEGSTSNEGAVIGKIPLLSGKPLDAAARSKYVVESHQLQSDTIKRLIHALQRVVPSLPFSQGQVRARVLFGIFELRVFKCPQDKDALPYDEFLANIKLTGTKGNLIRDLKVAVNAASILEKVFSANDLLVPADAVTDTLGDVAPVISGRFVFHRYEKPSVEFETEFSSSSMNDRLYEVTHAQWRRHDQKETRTPFETFVIRLDGGCSWKLKISNEHVLDQSRIDPKMTAFADSVNLRKFDKHNLALTGQKHLDWVRSNFPGSLKPSEFEQKISYRYRLVPNSAWMFEIARYDSYGPHEDTPVITNWGASMWNTNWEEVLAQNSGLKIGEAADWDPCLSTFFPNEDSSNSNPESSISEFLQTVQMVNDFLDEIKTTGGAKELPPHLRG